MKIAIFGSKNEAVYFNRQLTEHYSGSHTAKCFIDNNPQFTGKVIDGLLVVSFNQFIEEYSKDIDAVIIAVKSLKSMSEIAEQLRRSSIQKIGCVKTSIYEYNKRLTIDESGNSSLILWLDDANKPILSQLEANIIDKCNLRCKGCSHFSTLFSEENYYDLESFERDLTQMADKCYITALNLLGGEPLLCSDLNKYVDLSRKILPQSEITIVTNGLLILKQPDKLYDSVRKNDVEFRITPYKPTVKMKDKITEFLLSQDVNFRFGNLGENEEILEFGKMLSKTYDSNGEKSMLACLSSACRFLRQGKLYKCPVEGMIYKFFEAYNINNDLKCGIDIYNVSDWNKTIEELKNPVEACRYCTEKPELMDWEVVDKPDMQDWIVTQ